MTVRELNTMYKTAAQDEVIRNRLAEIGLNADDMLQGAEAEIAKLDKRNASRSSKPNKKQLENEPIKVEILEYLVANKKGIASEIATALTTEERPISTSKVSALAKQMVTDGALIEEEVKIAKVGKRKSYSIAPTDGE